MPGERGRCRFIVSLKRGAAGQRPGSAASNVRGRVSGALEHQSAVAENPEGCTLG
jgi:hypothetical protein